jgi:cytochrome d ubiquinol oxidase subunit I
MVGLGTLMSLLAVWFALSWLFRRDMPRSRWFLWIAAAAGVLSVVAMEAGWIVTEVGRQPWIVYNLMTVTDAATENAGVWVTFLVVAAVYVVVAITTILVLRLMSQRFRVTGGGDENVAYGPRPTPAVARRDGEA